MRFRDRAEAGRRLALRLRRLRFEPVVVLGIARSGVPVAFEVAQALGAPLDVIAVRRLHEARDSETTVGAVAEDGTTSIDPDTLMRLRLKPRDLEALLAREKRELARRLAAYRHGRPAISLPGMTVIIVDDGIASGETARAAIGVARRRGATRIGVAAPLASHEGIEGLRAIADDVVSVEAPPFFVARSEWYAEAAVPTEEAVIELLDRAASRWRGYGTVAADASGAAAR